jgi:SAM-dependent methyltransferase
MEHNELHDVATLAHLPLPSPSQRERRMEQFWNTAFTEKQVMWGDAPTLSASRASASFAEAGVREVLIPGVGYGRNARAFLDRGMAVTGIEIAPAAIALARSALGLAIPIHEGSVTDMPFDRSLYGGIFCHGLIYLLDPAARAKLIADCYRQLVPGGQMIFTVIATTAPMYGEGARLGDNWFERAPGLPMFFYDPAAVQREFGAHGLVACTAIDEPMPGGGTFPFFYLTCTRRDEG